MSQKTFLITLAVFSLLCIPYLYQANSIMNWLQQDPDKGDHEYPKYGDLWIMLVCGTFCLIYEKFIYWLMYDFFYARSKGDDAEAKTF